VELLVESPRGLIAWHVRLRDRVATWLHSRAIDERLARGVAPEENVECALRAHELTQPRMRHGLACGVERAIASTMRARNSPFAILDRRQVLGALPELHALRARLDSKAMPSAQGVASARLLLTDGRSPLYNPASPRSLREALRSVLDAFDHM
jgi:hypothetical protein